MAKSLKKIVGLRVRELRKERGLSQSALADSAGTTLKTISLLERGETATNLDLVDSLARALEVGPARLFGLSPKAHSLDDCLSVVSAAAKGAKTSPPTQFDVEKLTVDEVRQLFVVVIAEEWGGELLSKALERWREKHRGQGSGEEPQTA